MLGKMAVLPEGNITLGTAIWSRIVLSGNTERLGHSNPISVRRAALVLLQVALGVERHLTWFTFVRSFNDMSVSVQS